MSVVLLLVGTFAMSLADRVMKLVGKEPSDDQGSDSFGSDEDFPNENDANAEEEVEEVVELEEAELIRMLDAEEDPHAVCTRLLNRDAFPDPILQDLLNKGYHVQDEFLTEEEASGLVNTALQLNQDGKMMVAGEFRERDPLRDHKARDDVIMFLHPKDGLVQDEPAISIPFNKLQKLGQNLRRFAKLSDRDCEVQLALYAGNGGKYDRHRDSLPSDASGANDDWGKSQRRITTICYGTNSSTFTEASGGQLRLFPSPMAGSGEIDISPKPGRLVVFLSGSMDHAVCPCFTNRVAMTVWWH
jgi:hypothetical protein